MASVPSAEMLSSWCSTIPGGDQRSRQQPPGRFEHQLVPCWRWHQYCPAETLSSWCSTIPGGDQRHRSSPWEVRAPARTLLAVASVLSGGNAVELVLDNPREVDQRRRSSLLGGSSTSSYLAGGGLGVVQRNAVELAMASVPSGGNAVELVLDNPRGPTWVDQPGRGRV